MMTTEENIIYCWSQERFNQAFDIFNGSDLTCDDLREYISEGHFNHCQHNLVTMVLYFEMRQKELNNVK